MGAAPIFQKRRCRKGRFRWSYEQAEWVCLRPGMFLFYVHIEPPRRPLPLGIVIRK